MPKYKYKHGSHHLTLQQAERIFNGAIKAYDDGCELNRHFTLHLEDTIWKKNPQKFLSLMMNNSRKWLKRRDVPLKYIWVLEKGEYKGIHAHVLIHIPAGLQIPFKQALWRWYPWLKPYHKATQISYPIYGKLHPLSGIYGVVSYICKGTKTNTKPDNKDDISDRLNHAENYNFRDTFIPHLKTSYQGYIVGARMGMNLG